MKKTFSEQQHGEFDVYSGDNCVQVKCLKGSGLTELVYVGDDSFALLQVGGSEAVHRQHDERRADEAESIKTTETRQSVNQKESCSGFLLP